jgi:hypothetical protein
MSFDAFAWDELRRTALAQPRFAAAIVKVCLVLTQIVLQPVELRAHTNGGAAVDGWRLFCMISLLKKIAPYRADLPKTKLRPH